MRRQQRSREELSRIHGEMKRGRRVAYMGD
jgi:hypothetical protein